MKKVILLINKFKKHLICLLGLMCLNMIISFGLPWLNKIVIDEIITERKLELVNIVIFAYISGALVSVILYIVIPLLNTNINEKIILRLRNKLTKNVLYREGKTINSTVKGDLLNVYNQDIPQVASLITISAKDLLEYTITLIITIGILLFVDFRVAIISFVSIPFYLLLPIIFNKKVELSTNKVQERHSKINTTVEENLNGAQQIKIFNKEDFIFKKSAKIFESLIPLKIKQLFYVKIANSTLIIYWLNMLLVLWIGGRQVVEGNLSIGMLLVMINYIDRIEWPITRIAQVVTEYQAGKVSIKRFEKYYIYENDNKIIPGENVKLGLINEVEFEDVFFRYSQSDDDVLEKINLKIYQGESLGIIGRSGVGKSTLVNLLFGLYQPNSGLIKINGTDIKNINMRDYRDKIGYMSQDIFLFETSIYENIAFGSSSEVSKDEIIQATKKAEADQFIKDLPNGYDSVYRGENLDLSNGQKQRIALSRIFLKNPDIIVLDEPTSSLDPYTKELIFSTLFEFIGDDKILIVISHDHENLDKFDSVIELKDKKI